MIELIVISDDEYDSVYIHETLYEKSRLYEVVKKSGFIYFSGTDGWIDTYDQPKDVVVGYIDWLYHREIAGYEHDDGDTMYYELAQLYIFGYKIQDDAFCNDVLKVILKGIDKPPQEGNRWLPDVEVAALVYEMTEKGCALRRLLVDCTVELSGGAWFEDVVGSAPPEFVEDLLKRFAMLKRKGQSKGLYQRREEWLTSG